MVDAMHQINRFAYVMGGARVSGLSDAPSHERVLLFFGAKRRMNIQRNAELTRAENDPRKEQSHARVTLLPVCALLLLRVGGRGEEFHRLEPLRGVPLQMVHRVRSKAILDGVGSFSTGGSYDSLGRP